MYLVTCLILTSSSINWTLSQRQLRSKPINNEIGFKFIAGHGNGVDFSKHFIRQIEPNLNLHKPNC